MKAKCLYSIIFLLSITQPMPSQTVLKKINCPSGDVVNCMTISNNGKPYLAGDWSGIYTSNDEGLSWIRLSYSGTFYHDLIVGADNNLYVAARELILILDQSGNNILYQYFNTDVYSLALDSQLHLYAATKDSGIIKTTNYGESWEVNIVLPDSNYHFTSVMVDKDDNIFIGTYAGVLKSTDNGITWASKNSGLRDLYIFDIMCASNGYIFITNNDGIARSTNGGDYWEYVNTGIQSNTVLRKIEEDENSNLYFGDEAVFGKGMIYKSSNWGDNWYPVFQTNAGRITSILPIADYLLIGSAESGLFRAKLKDSSIATVPIKPISSLYFVQNQFGEYYTYYEPPARRYISLSTDYGNTWRVMEPYWQSRTIGGLWYEDSILFVGAMGGQIGLINDRRIKYYWELNQNDCGWPSTILYDPDSNFIFISTKGIGIDCSFGIYKGRLDTNITFLSNIDNGVDVSLPITSLGINSLKHLFAGVDFHGIYKSSDLGLTWELTNNDSSDLITVQRIKIDRKDNIYACTIWNIFRSTDDGESWTKIADYEVNGFEIDSQNNLYVAVKNAEHFQVLKSTNLGISWEIYGEMLEDSYVNGLFLNDSSYLFVYTNSGIYRSAEPVTDVVDDIQYQPVYYYLSQNYPNPFNPITTIKFQIASTSFVSLIVYDILGREIKSLVNEKKPAGSYEVEFDAMGLPSGVYFYTLKTGEFTQTKKMILLR